MLTLSKPISAGQAQAYHRSEFANAKENYSTEGERVRGEWQGQQRRTAQRIRPRPQNRQYEGPLPSFRLVSVPERPLFLHTCSSQRSKLYAP